MRKGDSGLAVKPSASPSMVRIHHLPLPAEIARKLRVRGLAGCSFGRREVPLRPCESGCFRCARTYSGQRPGRTNGSLNRLSPLLRLSVDRLAAVPARLKIIGGSRSGPRIARGIGRRARVSPRYRDPRRNGRVVAALGSAAVISASPDCAACRPGPRCSGSRPGALGATCALPPRRVTLCVWTFDGPAVHLRWTLWGSITGSGLCGLPVGFQNSATSLDLGFYAAHSYSLMRPPRTGRRLMRSWERSASGVVGPGRVELAAAMGSSSVAVGLVLGQDRPQMSLAEHQHPVGDLRLGGEHEPFRMSVRAGFGAGSSRPRCRRRPGSRQTGR